MKGITLIALIITIIVLLILAGVVINMTMGNDGIIGKTQGAVDMYKNAQEKEEYEIAKIESEINNYSRGTVTLTDEEYKTLLDRISALENNSIRYPDYTRLITQLTGNPTDGWNVPTGLLPWGTSGNAKTWTATEDCFLVASLASYYGASPEVYVDGVCVVNLGDSAGNYATDKTAYQTFGRINVFVKKGSVVSTRDVAGANPKNSNYNILIYALKSL